MNKYFLNLVVVFIFSLSVLISSSFAQTLELNNNQTFTIAGPTFIPFTPTANDQLKNLFPTNSNVSLTFTNFLGSPCQVAPARDFSEIGDKTNVTGNTTLSLDFSMAGQNANLFGLSFVPNGGTCIFDLLITPPSAASISSSGSTSGTLSNTFTPNALSIFGGYLSDNLALSLLNGTADPSATEPNGIEISQFENETQSTNVLDQIFNTLGIGSTGTNNNTETSTLAIPTNKSTAKTSYDQKLTNTTDLTKVFATVLLPTLIEEGSSSLTVGNRVLSIEKILKAQVPPDLIALAAVQHSIVSATMPWQLSPNGGFFITQGGGYLGPFCTIVESGRVVLIPGGACTPEKLNKRKAGFTTLSPSKFFDPFPYASMTIQIPTANIVDPKHPLIAKAVREKAYLILQPVPPKSKLIQKIKLTIKKSD